MRTELLLHGEIADFVVLTTDARFQHGLLKMGWTGAGDERFSRRMTATTDVPRVFANFSRHIVEMLEQVTLLRPVAWEEALLEFIDRAGRSDLQWWLYGSAALAVRGVPVQPKDIDLVVDDPLLAGQLLDDLLVEPVRPLSGWVADWGGRAYSGAIIEWLSGAHPTGLQPPHEQEPLARDHLEQVAWRGRHVPVPSLELSLKVAMHRGLADRVEVIRSFQRDVRG